MPAGGKPPESKAGSCHPPSSGVAAAPSPSGGERRWEAHNPALAHGSSRFLRHSKIWPESLFAARPPPWLDACLIAYLFISVFSQLPAHTGAGWGGKPRPAPNADPKKKRKPKKRECSSPHSPEGGRKLGSAGLAGKGVGAGGRKGGRRRHRPPPLLCARLGKLKIAASKEWLQAPQRAC